MSILLSVVNDNDNVLNKVKNDSISINVRIPLSIDLQNPVIELAGVGTDYSIYNYMDIPTLGRSYFVEFEQITPSRVRLYGRIDLLESYKDDILISNALIKRPIKTGDYQNVNIDSNVNSTITKYNSNAGLVYGESTIIFNVSEV